MAVSLRLQRIGKPHQAYYRLVAIHRTRALTEALEVLGSYNPRGKTKDKVVQATGWTLIKNGAQATETVSSLSSAHKAVAVKK